MIGVSIFEATQRKGLKDLPDGILSILSVDINVDTIKILNVTSREAQPTFLPAMFKNADNGLTSIRKALLDDCNSLAKDVPRLWTYLKLLDPRIRLPEGYADEFTFDDLYKIAAYEDFKLIARYYVFQLRKVLCNVLEIIRDTTAIMTRLAIATFEAQSDVAKKSSIALGLTFRSDVIGQSESSTQTTTNDVLREFSSWFARHLDDIEHPSLDALKATSVHERIGFTEDLFDCRLDMPWLAKLLRGNLFSMCATIWYGQLYLAGPWVSDILANYVKESQEEFRFYNDQLQDVEKVLLTPGVKHATSFQNKIMETITEQRSYDKFNAQTDMPLLVVCLNKLFNDETPTPDELERLDDLCKKVAKHDMITLIYLFMATDVNILCAAYEALDDNVSLIQGRAVVEILEEKEQILREIDELDIKITSNLDESMFAETDTDVKRFVQLLEKHYDSIIANNAGALELISEYRADSVFRDMKPIVLTELQGLFMQRITLRKKLQTLAQEEAKSRTEQRSASNTGLLDLRNEVQRSSIQAKNIEGAIYAEVQNLSQGTTAEDFEAALHWYEATGTREYVNGVPAFARLVSTQTIPVFSLIDPQELSGLCRMLERWILLSEKVRAGEAQIAKHMSSLKSVRRRWFWGLIIIFGLITLSLIYGVTWWCDRLPSWASFYDTLPSTSSTSTQQGATTKAPQSRWIRPAGTPQPRLVPPPSPPTTTPIPGETTRSAYARATDRIPGIGQIWRWLGLSDAPLVRGYGQAFENYRAGAGLTYFGWSTIDPRLLYGPMIGIWTGAEYAMAFWTAATFNGYALARIAWIQCDIWALDRVHAIDSSPELATEMEISTNRGGQAALGLLMFTTTSTAVAQIQYQIAAQNNALFGLGLGAVSVFGGPAVRRFISRNLFHPNMIGLPGLPMNPQANQSNPMLEFFAAPARQPPQPSMPRRNPVMLLDAPQRPVYRALARQPEEQMLRITLVSEDEEPPTAARRKKKAAPPIDLNE
jgi:hypothetical protein